VALKKPDEALLAAERGRTRAFVDLLLERQTSQKSHRLEDNICTTVENLLDIVNRQKASVLYYSIAAGYLHAWLLIPNKGATKF